uniref:Uncharacterized protein n=1 Tax=Caenorhabditis japonica TaxID=281687 RepID=A0A8R1EDP8_CAEJA
MGNLASITNTVRQTIPENAHKNWSWIIVRLRHIREEIRQKIKGVFERNTPSENGVATSTETESRTIKRPKNSVESLQEQIEKHIAHEMRMVYFACAFNLVFICILVKLWVF